MSGLLNPDNRLFTLARQGRCPPSALVSIAVVFVTLVGAIIPGQLLARIVLFSPAGVPRFRSGIQSIVEPVAQNVTIFLLIYLGLWVWLRVSSKRPFWTLGLERQDALRRALRGVVVAALMMAATAGLSIIPGASFAPGLAQTMGLAAFGIRVSSLLSYCVQGPAEEVLFRGWLLPAIGARYGPWIGVMVSSVVFSLAHALSQGITALGFVNLFLFGVFASVYALADGGLWGIGAWHAAWNWTMGDLLGFALDGSPHVGLFSSIRAEGPEIISGGAFGLEGGLACTAVLLSAIGIMAMRTRRFGDGRSVAS
jgi:membrane protease YdiL (CAAX protease family)